MKRFAIAGLLASAVLAAASRAADKDADPRVAQVAQGDNQFALDLYAKLRGEDGNLFFSPYSISTALAMTRAGARGDTAAEMDKVMHFTLPQEKLHPAFAGLIKEVNGDPTDKEPGYYQLSTANALWGQKDFGFKADVLKLLKDSYGAGLTELDFGATEASRKTINGWVEKETHDKIKDLLQQGDLTVDTRLVLTNAIYFKGDWASHFKKDLTKAEPFHLTADKKADAPMMRQQREYAYFDGGSFQAVELPYVKDLSMVVLLPKKIDGLADLEKDLTAEKLAGWVGKLHKQEVIVNLPKFKTEQRVSLGKTLSEMGMKLAFDDQKADLSGMAGKSGDLYIAAVIHKAFVDVNEEGTEAAAATAVIVAKPTAVRIEPPTPVFRADHPFLFLIRDTRSDSILFLGRLADPKP